MGLLVRVLDGEGPRRYPKDERLARCDEPGSQEVRKMDRHEISGRWHEVKGGVKRSLGRATGDDELRAEGNVEKAKGGLQWRLGRVVRSVRNGLDRILDTIFRSRRAGRQRPGPAV